MKKTVIKVMFAGILFFSCQRTTDSLESFDDSIVETIVGNPIAETPMRQSYSFVNSKNVEIIKSLSKKYKNNKLIETNNSRVLANTQNSSLDNDYIYLYNEAVNYLLSTNEFTQEDLQELFPIKYDYRVIITAISVSKLVENANINKNNSLNRYADTYQTFGVGNCVLEATGIKALAEGSMKKAAGRIAKRFVPYVGWGLAAADFADCMGWF